MFLVRVGWIDVDNMANIHRKNTRSLKVGKSLVLLLLLDIVH